VGLVRALVRRSIPARSRQALRRAARRIGYFGRDRFCPVCGSRCRAFLADTRTGRPDAACPVCGSRERHRSIWPFLVEETPLARAPLRVLHVAPEGCFERRLRALPLRAYVTLDLARDDVAVRGDLCRLGFAAESFDFALCNHVLEHVADDCAAMRELFRVLAPGGWAVLTVPGPDPRLGFPERLAETVEDAGVRSPEERLRRYGHPGHLRLYGADLADRLRAAGFAVSRRDHGAQEADAEKRRRGVYRAYPIFLCRKPREPWRRFER
jgi:SAM-dependent methyltransferase